MSSFPCLDTSPPTETELAECLNRLRSVGEPKPRCFKANSPPISTSTTSNIRYKPTQEPESAAANKRMAFATASSDTARLARAIVRGGGGGLLTTYPSGPPRANVK